MEIVSLILFGVLGLPLAVVGAFVLLMATGVIREPEGAEIAAENYRQSWNSAGAR
jgi:hypothetical protein